MSSRPVELKFGTVEQVVNAGSDGRDDDSGPLVQTGVVVAIGEAVAGAHVCID